MIYVLARQFYMLHTRVIYNSALFPSKEMYNENYQLPQINVHNNQLFEILSIYFIYLFQSYNTIVPKLSSDN